MSNNIRMDDICFQFLVRHFTPIEQPPITSSPAPELLPFISNTLHTVNLPPTVTFAALFLLQQLKNRFPNERCSSVHGLFVAALVIASKILLDHPYPNQTWVIAVNRTMTLPKINEMERVLLRYLQWNVTIHAPDLHGFIADVVSSRVPDDRK